MKENETVGWHHRLNGHKFEQAPEDGVGCGSLARCSPWGHKESDMTERLNKKSKNYMIYIQLGVSFPLNFVIKFYSC